MPKLARAAATILALFWLSACASVSVDKVTHSGDGPKVPKMIYVENFEAPREVFRVGRSGHSFVAFRKSLQTKLRNAIVQRVNKRLAPSQPLPGSAVPEGAQAWLVSGRFVTVNQGSRLLRTVLGLGAGGTKLKTAVTVFDCSAHPPRPILKFVTTGGTNSQPGAVFGLAMPNYWLIALDSAGKSAPGLSMDMIRTSREIVAVLSEYMAQEGFLSPAKVSRAKKLGQWP